MIRKERERDRERERHLNEREKQSDPHGTAKGKNGQDQAVTEQKKQRQIEAARIDV